MRTSNDADYLAQRTEPSARNAIDALVRDVSGSIYLDDDLCARTRARALAAMRPSPVMH